jgi:hypothetical protein
VALEHRNIGWIEIVTHDTDHSNLSEVTRSDREVRGCATELRFTLACRGFNRVIRYRTNNQNFQLNISCPVIL